MKTALFLLMIMVFTGISNSTGAELNNGVVVHINGPKTFCMGDLLVINVVPPDTTCTYLWSTGEVGDKISISQSGTYWVKATSKSGDTGFDTLFITALPKPKPVVSYQGLPQLCPGSSKTLFCPVRCVAYLWSTGEKSDSIIITTPGEYYVEVTDTNACTAVSPAVDIIVGNSLTPIIIPTNNGILCSGKNVVLTTDIEYSSYLWSTGDTVNHISVSLPGKYWVTVTDGNGCSGVSQTVNITVGNNPKPKILSTNNGIICNDDYVYITTDKEYSSYSWSTGDSELQIMASYPGQYWVTVTDENGCSGTSDTILIKRSDLKQLLLDGDTLLCKGDTAGLSLAYDYTSYLWSTGDTTKGITITGPGLYSVTVTDTNGCIGSTQIGVMEYETILTGIKDIDFGKYNLGSEVTDSIIITNDSPWDIPVNDIKLKGMDGNSFAVSTDRPLPTILTKKSEMVVYATLKITSGKNYLDSVIIQTEGMCPRTFSFCLMGQGNDVKAVVWFPDIIGVIGDEDLKLPLMAMMQTDTSISQVNYKTEISFNAEYFRPDSVTGATMDSNYVTNGERIIKISGKTDFKADSADIATIHGMVLLGAKNKTPLHISGFSPSNPDIIISKTDGSLAVSGVCKQDIDGLQPFTPTKFIISPNPAGNSIILNGTMTENSNYAIRIYDMLGSSRMEMNGKAAGDSVTKELDIENLHSGIYYIMVNSETGNWRGMFVKE